MDEHELTKLRREFIEMVGSEGGVEEALAVSSWSMLKIADPKFARLTFQLEEAFNSFEAYVEEYDESLG